ncbi:MAG: hypothetical protein QM779_10405 [Propionicimonas sp.]|uniref:hypothetical protein n=1 Tax=Propionicimonas sp. TaxID=1955623 RepID=UPI003D0F4001
MARVPLIVTAIVGVGLCTGCVGAPSTTATPVAPASPTQRVVLRLDFDGPDPLALTDGSAAVRAASVFGGKLQLVTHGEGKAVEFPSFSSAENPPGLVLIATGEGDQLPDPGERDFSFGADVLLHSDAADAEDNGDNVIQRGLAADPTQFKLQVDHGVPSCVVAGDGGRVIAKGHKLDSEVWYSLACARTGDTLVLTVTRGDSSDLPATASGSGPIGAVTIDADRPVSMGRKVTAWGEPVVNQPDQFNGVMDAVWVSIAE